MCTKWGKCFEAIIIFWLSKIIIIIFWLKVNSQLQISKLLGISQTNYSKYELEKINLPIDSLIKLAKLYKTSTDYILGLTNDFYMELQTSSRKIFKGYDEFGNPEFDFTKINYKAKKNYINHLEIVVKLSKILCILDSAFDYNPLVIKYINKQTMVTHASADNNFERK